MIQDHKHDVSDPGHSHDYTDSYPDHTGGNTGNTGSGSVHWFPPTHHKTTEKQMTGVKVEGI